MKQNPWEPYYQFAVETVYQAGRLTLAYFQSNVSVEWKDNKTPVTQADRQAEAFIREQIQKRYPNHALLGEEFGVEGNESSPYRWYIDPIDGTKSFMRGVPLYAVLIGLEVEGEVKVGAAYFPALDEMLAAARGMGCWWNGRRARVSQVERLDKAFISITTTQNLPSDKKASWEKLQRECYFQAGWGDAYGYLLVATGRLEAMFDPKMNSWDCAPFPPILEEAGGYFGDWKGHPGIHYGEALATNGVMKEEILKRINS